MKYLYSVQEKRKGRKMIIEVCQCPSLSAAKFMIGRVAQEGSKYRIRKQELVGDRLFYSNPTEGFQFFRPDGRLAHGGEFR